MHTQGESLDEIKIHLKEAVELWFEAASPAASQGEDQILELAI
jgi:predicted RNase H-like HicB family nuclease